MAVAESGVIMTYMSAAQIAADLIRRIRAGEWKPDSPLPPFAELAKRYDCPESRIKHAMVRVGLSGAAEYRQGKGWYVTGAPTTGDGWSTHRPRPRPRVFDPPPK